MNFQKNKVENEDQSTNKIQIMGFPVEHAIKNYKKIKLRVKNLIFRRVAIEKFLIFLSIRLIAKLEIF